MALGGLEWSSLRHCYCIDDRAFGDYHDFFFWSVKSVCFYGIRVMAGNAVRDMNTNFQDTTEHFAVC